jgi:enhancing lycopene biosynthesis protein 2
VLVEAARIARGHIRDLAEVKAAQLDALVMPGGFGAAKNLCDFASKGASATPHPEAARLLREMHAAGKPIGAICIAPALVASVLGRSAAPLLTVGEDGEAAAAITKMGAKHRPCPVTGCVVDEKNRIVTTPAYMSDARIADVATGIDELVAAMLLMLPTAARGAR